MFIQLTLLPSSIFFSASFSHFYIFVFDDAKGGENVERVFREYLEECGERVFGENVERESILRDMEREYKG